MASGIVKVVKGVSPLALFFKMRRAAFLRQYGNRDLRLGLGANLINCQIGHRVSIGERTVFSHSSIGDNSYINGGAIIKHATIGKFCSIGPGVKIGLGNHPLDLVSTHPAFYANNKPFMTFSDKLYYKEYEDVLIGNDVWIGEDVMIPGGVTIGDGAVIGAGAVLTKNVEPYAFVGGVPARFIKYRFDEPLRTKLLQSRWWDKDISWLKENYLRFHNPGEFVKLFES